MDLSYPPAIQTSLDRLSQALSDVTVKDELEACERPDPLSPLAGEGKAEGGAPASSPLAQVAEFRALGAYALPLSELLDRSGRSNLPLPEGATAGATALGWPDASAPWQSGDLLTVEFDSSDKLAGTVSVAPFCIPARALAFLAQRGAEVALVEAVHAGSTERSGDGFTVSFPGAGEATVLAEGADAVAAWDRAVLWERLALLGLTLGLLDRCWRIALDALCEGKRAGKLLADEQVAQFQLADNDIERLSAQNLILDAAVDVESGKASAVDKLALVRYFTAGQAERCAARALHVAQLFTPRMVPIARWFVQRSHHLATFSAAREYEVRSASNGVIAGLSLE